MKQSSSLQAELRMFLKQLPFHEARVSYHEAEHQLQRLRSHDFKIFSKGYQHKHVLFLMKQSNGRDGCATHGTIREYA